MRSLLLISFEKKYKTVRHFKNPPKYLAQFIKFCQKSEKASKFGMTKFGRGLYKKIILVPLTFFILSFCLPFIIRYYMFHLETGNENVSTDQSPETDMEIGTKASTSF